MTDLIISERTYQWQTGPLGIDRINRAYPDQNRFWSAENINQCGLPNPKTSYKNLLSPGRDPVDRQPRALWVSQLWCLEGDLNEQCDKLLNTPGQPPGIIVPERPRACIPIRGNVIDRGVWGGWVAPFPVGRERPDYDEQLFWVRPNADEVVVQNNEYEIIPCRRPGMARARAKLRGINPQINGLRMIIMLGMKGRPTVSNEEPQYEARPPDFVEGEGDDKVAIWDFPTSACNGDLTWVTENGDIGYMNIGCVRDPVTRQSVRIWGARLRGSNVDCDLVMRTRGSPGPIRNQTPTACAETVENGRRVFWGIWTSLDNCPNARTLTWSTLESTRAPFHNQYTTIDGNGEQGGTFRAKLWGLDNISPFARCAVAQSVLGDPTGFSLRPSECHINEAGEVVAEWRDVAGNPNPIEGSHNSNRVIAVVAVAAIVIVAVIVLIWFLRRRPNNRRHW